MLFETIIFKTIILKFRSRIQLLDTRLNLFPQNLFLSKN